MARKFEANPWTEETGFDVVRDFARGPLHRLPWQQSNEQLEACPASSKALHPKKKIDIQIYAEKLKKRINLDHPLLKTVIC